MPVSIIIPMPNEEAELPGLLGSYSSMAAAATGVPLSCDRQAFPSSTAPLAGPCR